MAPRLTAKEIAEGVHACAPGPFSGNVYLVRSHDGWVLVDTGAAGTAPGIRALADALFGRGIAPSAILLTHVHPDHAGSARTLARAWSCPVYVHPDEMDLAVARDLATVERYATPLDRRLILPVLRILPRRRVERMLAADSLEEHVRPLPPDGAVPGLPAWAALETAGHTPGHTSFFRAEDRLLITGDALLTVDIGSVGGLLSAVLRPQRVRVTAPPAYLDLDRRRALASALRLARLGPRVLAPGHGIPLAGAVARMHLEGFLRRQQAG
jgi:glyoxylase-like metal-dependent hydrolase (beta-lactamase superfamily II)